MPAVQDVEHAIGKHEGSNPSLRVDLHRIEDFLSQ
jgi:hypothetical protein